MRKTQIREQLVYGNKSKHLWEEAAKRWCVEMKHKRTLDQDLDKFVWLQTHFKGIYVEDIKRQDIESLAQLREDEGVSSATVNRLLALIRAVLNKAYKQWEWIEKVPYIRMRKEDNNRIRYITTEEANVLLTLLPSHLSIMALFTLQTGLRAGNVTGLQWSDVDLDNRRLTIKAENFKTGINFGIPLNDTAFTILNTLKKASIPSEYCFTYKGQRIKQCNTKAFRNALKAANIKNFRWHDLRHTWASWHVQNGTSLQELQQLGGWASFDMVLRYAHLSPDNLKQAANRIKMTRNYEKTMEKGQQWSTIGNMTNKVGDN